MRSSCAAQPALLAQFEGLLFPAAQTVMAGEVLEFLPYVFQLLALALHLSPAPAPPPQPAAPAQPSYSPAFKGLLPHLLQRRPWERKSSVPALAELLRVYLEKGAAGELLGGGGGGLGTVVGIAGMLLGSRGHETLAFALLDSLLTHVPLEALAPQLPSIFNGLQACVMASKALRIAKCFIHTAALLCGLRGPPALVAALSAGQLPALVESVLAPYAARLEGRVARSEAAIGLTRLLCECPELLAGGRDPGAWCKLLGAVVELVGGAGGAAGAAGAPAASRAALLGGSAALMEDEELPEDVDAGAPPPEYTASYNRLLHCALPSASAFASAGLPAPAVYLSQSLQRLAASNPAVQGIIAASPVAAQVASLPRA
jgi:exportin-2 (importin alpha re-exporter)